MKKLISIFCLGFALMAQSTLPIVYTLVNPNQVIALEAQALPLSPTTVITGSFVISGGWISCSTGRTVTMTDGNGINIGPALVLAANQLYGLSTLAGTLVSGGFQWSANGASCNGSISIRK